MCKVLLLAAAAFVAAVSAETSVELIAPIEGTDGPQFGLIFIPGATLGGETYGPLSVAMQGGTRCPIQGSAKRQAPSLVNLIPALAHLFWLYIHATWGSASSRALHFNDV